ncbi:MAG: endonuclease III [Bacteroidota bacterium]
MNVIEKRYQHILAWFETNNPLAATELIYKTPYELIVAVVLSAQCTDKRVNMITPAFFEKFPDINFLACSEVSDVFEVIKSCSYPNNKSKHLVGLAKMVVEKFNGIIPEDIESLQQLPGVGRKTANVMVSVLYDQPAMAVDTHVFRVSARLGLTINAKTPLETEKQLVKYIPQHLIAQAHHWLILHGRYVCKARKPLCAECGLTEYCVYFQKSIHI